MSDLTNVGIAASGSFFAACAAGASWISVVHSQRQSRESRQPDLQISAEQVIGSQQSNREAMLTVTNAGAGVATGSAFILAVGDTEYCCNGLGSGSLHHRQKADARMKIESHQPLRALVMCRDLGARVWVSDLQGECKAYDGRRFDPRRDFAMFWSDFYGENLSNWQRIGSTVTMSD
jgi:hypothetical protein